MTKDQEQKLKNKLRGILREVGFMTDIKQDVMNEFKSRGLDALRPAWVFTENLDLDTLTDSEDDIMFLFLFSYALNKALKEKNMNLIEDYENYFTKMEIGQWENFKEQAELDNIFPINFKETVQISPGYWQTTLTAQQVEELNKANLLIYNPNTQRGLKSTKKSIGIDLNPKKVETIAERMLEGKQFADDLKLNVLKGEVKPIYNPKTRILTLREGSIINIWDGMHRKSANSLALSKEPNLEYTWPIKITNYSEIETHSAMVQINEQTPIKKEVISPKDYSKPENLVLDKIMDSYGDLSTVTKDTDAFVKSDRALTTKSIIAKAIGDNYNNLESAMKRDEVANWIVEFTNYLMGIYSEEFIVNPYKIKKTSYINNQNMFYGYIALSATLQNNKKWKDVLKQKINSIDFNIDNPIWKEIGIIKDNKINKTTKNKIYNLFKEV